MVDQGFLAPRPIRPGTVGLVVLGHAAVLAAVILAKGPLFIPHPRVITDIYTVPPETPPPPEPLPQPRAKAAPSRLDTPRREIETPPTTPVAFDPLPQVDPTPGPRIDEPVIVALPPPPVHQAVLIDAAPDPRYAGGFQPPYPPALQRAEVEGRAVVRVLVGADGRVSQVEIVSADDPAFAEATRRQALRSWRFRPATRDGVAVESWRTMTVHFRMQA